MDRLLRIGHPAITYFLCLNFTEMRTVALRPNLCPSVSADISDLKSVQHVMTLRTGWRSDRGCRPAAFAYCTLFCVINSE